jgi:serine/threonine-protein kinase PBS1
MSCFPCLGKKKNEQADPSGHSHPDPASNMTPPELVYAPAEASSPAAKPAAPPNDAKRPNGGGEGAIDFLISSEIFEMFASLTRRTDSTLRCRRRGDAAGRHLGAGVRVPRAGGGDGPLHTVQPRREGGFFRVYKGQLEKNGQVRKPRLTFLHTHI